MGSSLLTPTFLCSFVAGDVWPDVSYPVDASPFFLPGSLVHRCLCHFLLRCTQMLFPVFPGGSCAYSHTMLHVSWIVISSESRPCPWSDP